MILRLRDMKRLPRKTRVEFDAWLKAEGYDKIACYELEFLDGGGLRLGCRETYPDGRIVIMPGGDTHDIEVYATPQNPPPERLLDWMVRSL